MNLKKCIMVVWLIMSLIMGIVGATYALPIRPVTFLSFSDDLVWDSTAREERGVFFTSKIEESFDFSLLTDVHSLIDTIKKPALKHPMPTGIAGVKIFIDPETGQITTPPAEVKARERRIKLSAKMQNALSTSSAGLTMRKSDVPGGGYIIDLKGRFQQGAVVTLESDGTMKKR